MKAIIDILRSLVILPLLLLSLAATAQTEKNGNDKLVGDLNVGMGTSHDGVKPLELCGNIGYRFIPKMYAFVHGGVLYWLCDNEKSYAKHEMLGGGLGYTLYKADWFSLDLRGIVATNISNAEKRLVTYDASMIFHVGGGKLKMNIGAGFRHTNLRMTRSGAYNGFYGTIGFGF